MPGIPEIVKNNKLISFPEWENYINSLKTDKVLNEKKAIASIKNTLTSAIKNRASKLKKFGILFSGGVDSSSIALIAKKLNCNFICYSVGLENSKDLVSAEEVALHLNFKLKTKKLNLNEAEEIIKKVTKVLKKEADVVNVGVACVVYSAAGMAKNDKIAILFSGLGSEEIFAGYQRHKEAKNVNEECWKGLKFMWERDLKRDYLIAKHLKIKLLTPFLDKEIIKTAMQIPGEYKIKGNIVKYILREAAIELGLPKEFAFRKKLAAQYGSNFDKAIEKLARKNGFRYKKDYLESLLS